MTAQDHHSIFDGRDIQKPTSTDKMTPSEVSMNLEDGTEMEEDMEQTKRPRATERNTVCRDQLLDLFENEDEVDSFTCCILADSSITVEEALASSEAEEWQDAVASEERGLKEKGVLVKSPCPENIRPLKTRYILTKKLGPDGSIIRFKARRVVQGFHQTYGKDFFETFAPVIGFDTLRLILGLSIWNKWPIMTMDFKQAYLNANLKEEIYVKNPDGTTGKLNKALHGLKQAGLEWYKTLKDRILQREAWRPSQRDNCLYIAENQQTGRLAIMAVYVDDLLLAGSWMEELEEMQKHLLRRFEGTVDKDPSTYIGMELTRQQDDSSCIRQDTLEP